MGGAVCAGTPGIVLECVVHPLPAFPGVGVVLSEALGTVMDPRGRGLREFISAPSQRPPISPGSPGTSEPHVLIPRSWVTVLSAPQVIGGGVRGVIYTKHLGDHQAHLECHQVVTWAINVINFMSALVAMMMAIRVRTVTFLSGTTRASLTRRGVTQLGRASFGFSVGGGVSVIRLL